MTFPISLGIQEMQKKMFQINIKQQKQTNSVAFM